MEGPLVFCKKRQLQKVMITTFEKAFGHLVTERELITKRELATRFLIPMSGWLVQTAFWFGRREGVISFTHSIATEDSASHMSSGAIVGADAARQLSVLDKCLRS